MRWRDFRGGLQFTDLMALIGGLCAVAGVALFDQRAGLILAGVLLIAGGILAGGAPPED